MGSHAGAEQPKQTDVVVVGAGPIGLATAAMVQQAGLSVLVVETAGIGATIRRTFPPATRFFSSPERIELPGLPLMAKDQEKVTGEQYLDYLTAYARSQQLQIATFTKLVGLKRRSVHDLTVQLRSSAGAASQVDCRWLVLATGGTDRPRRLGVPGQDLPHVRTFLGDPLEFWGRRVVIVGGRNSAAESALRCYRAGANVTWVHRQPEPYARIKYWLRPELVSLLAEDRIHSHMPNTIASIHADHVVLGDGTRVECDDVLLQIGFEQNREIFGMAGLELPPEPAGPIIDETTMLSTQPDTFVVGTAIAGSQDHFAVFIENARIHAQRVTHAILQLPPPETPPVRPLPES